MSKYRSLLKQELTSVSFVSNTLSNNSKNNLCNEVTNNTPTNNSLGKEKRNTTINHNFLEKYTTDELTELTKGTDNRNKCINCIYLNGDYCRQWQKVSPDSKYYRPIKNILKRCNQFKLRHLSSSEKDQLKKWLLSINEYHPVHEEIVNKVCNESVEMRSYFLELAKAIS